MVDTNLDYLVLLHYTEPLPNLQKRQLWITFGDKLETENEKIIKERKRFGLNEKITELKVLLKN